MSELPTTIDGITGPWLTDALRRSGELNDDAEVTVKSAEPLSIGTAFATKMYRLTLGGADGAPASLVLKLPVEGEIRGLLDGIGAYVREVTFYSELADQVPVRVPKSYVAELAEDSTDFVLAIEDLSHLDPADQLAGLTLEQAETAVDNLARFHASSWESERLQKLADRFPPLDSEMGRGVHEQFGQFVGMVWPTARELPVVADEVREFGDRFPSLIPFFIERLATPRTIVHGELRADNLFLTPDDDLLMIDFQTVAQEAGIVDVAYLLSQSLSPEIRTWQDEGLVRRYQQALEHAGVEDYSAEQAWEQYRLAVAFNLLLPVLAFSQYEQTDDRGKQLLVEMLRRASDAIVANESLALLP
jgi:thiamine kinase-like enzyme